MIITEGLNMGYGKRDGSIRTFTPDNTDTQLYLISYIGLDQLVERVGEHFGTTDLSEFTIEAEHIHVDCLGYDRYDPSDYRNYLVITKIT